MKQIKPSERNRTIAEILEPLASLPVREDEGELWVWVESPKRCWSYLREDDSEWLELDFLHDPRGTVMLLEAMADPMVWRETSTLWGAEACDGPDGHPVAFHKELGLAVACAFLRANGYEVSE